MTIDELARAADITTRNVRAYQDRGLLPPPQKLGRTGYYGDLHLARLRVITRLLARGFSLQSIGDLFTTWEEGKSLGDVMGFEEAFFGLSGTDRVVHITKEDLEEWYGEFDIVMANRAADMGLLKRTDDGYDVPNVQLIEIGRALVSAGYDLSKVLDETRRLQLEAKVIAKRWLDLWEQQVWEPYVAAGSPPERLNEITKAMDQLREIPALAAANMVGDAMRNEADSRIAKLIASVHEHAVTKPPARKEAAS